MSRRQVMPRVAKVVPFDPDVMLQRADEQERKGYPETAAILREEAARERARQAAGGATNQRHNLRAVRFNFGADDPPIAGFTDDTYWNGALNVWVDEAGIIEVLATLRRFHDEAGGDDGGSLEEVRAKRPDAHGLYSLAHGYMTQEVG